MLFSPNWSKWAATFQIALKYDHEDMSQVLAKLMPSPFGRPRILDLVAPEFTSILDLMQVVRVTIPSCRMDLSFVRRYRSLLFTGVQTIGSLGDECSNWWKQEESCRPTYSSVELAVWAKMRSVVAVLQTYGKEQ